MAMRSSRGPVAIVLLLAAAAALGACGGAASESADPRATPSTPEATPGDAVGSSPTPVGASGPLADLLPDEVSGIELKKRTVLGPDLGEIDADEAASIAKVLANVDGPPEAFAVASATGEGLAIGAWRMEGTDGGQLGESFIAFILGQGEATVEDITIGGKDVKRVTPVNTDPLHVYVTGEIMFTVQAAQPALVEEAFALLP